MTHIKAKRQAPAHQETTEEHKTNEDFNDKQTFQLDCFQKQKNPILGH